MPCSPMPWVGSPATATVCPWAAFSFQPEAVVTALVFGDLEFPGMVASDPASNGGTVRAASPANLGGENDKAANNIGP